jgi:chromosome segregation ATPase
MTHDTTGRYWRFDICGHCNDPECCEGDSVDVSEEIAALRAERDEANERIALLVQKYEHEAKQLETERDQYRSDAGMREAQRDALFERLQVANAKMDTYERADGKLEAAIVRLQRELDALQVKYTDECFENERMRGVVEAAVEWIESWGCDSPDTKDEELALAINAYRAASSEANGISKLDPNSASSKQPHNHHRNIATNNPERNETDPAITSSTQDSNTDTDRETGHNDE